MTQLEVAAGLDPEALAMKATYQDVLRCESTRAEVFAGRGTPSIFGEPAEWIAILLQALRLTCEGRFEAKQAASGIWHSRAPLRPRDRSTISHSRGSGGRRRSAWADARGNHERPILLDSVHAPERGAHSRSRPTSGTSPGCPPGSPSRTQARVWCSFRLATLAQTSRPIHASCSLVALSGSSDLPKSISVSASASSRRIKVNSG